MVDHPRINVRGSDSSGAVFNTEYLERTQKVIPVNKNDLDTIMHFDLQGSVSTAIGIFLMSGAAWLGGEKVLEQLDKPEFHWTNVIVFCAACFLFGLYCLGNGLWSHHKKRRRIMDIFKETKEI